MVIRSIIQSAKLHIPLLKQRQPHSIRLPYARPCGTSFSLGKSRLIPFSDKLDYLARLETWDDGFMIARDDFYPVFSALDQCTYAIPTGRLHMGALRQLEAEFADNAKLYPKHKQPSIPLSYHGSLNVQWWRKWLSSPSPFAPEFDHPVGGGFFTDNRQPRIFVDASGWGVGIIVNDDWFAWQFVKGWDVDGRGIHWGETIAIELALRYVFSNSHLFPTANLPRIRIHSDSMLAIRALRYRKRDTTHLAAGVERIYQLCEAYKVKLELEFLRGKLNPADVPSRGYVPSTPKLIGIPALPEVLATSFRS